jgi:hypothetical protein
LEIKNRFLERSWIAMGETQALTPEKVEEIVIASL